MSNQAYFIVLSQGVSWKMFVREVDALIDAEPLLCASDLKMTFRAMDSRSCIVQMPRGVDKMFRNLKAVCCIDRDDSVVADVSLGMREYVQHMASRGMVLRREHISMKGVRVRLFDLNAFQASVLVEMGVICRADGQRYQEKLI